MIVKLDRETFLNAHNGHQFEQKPVENNIIAISAAQTDENGGDVVIPTSRLAVLYCDECGSTSQPFLVDVPQLRVVSLTEK
ncbi:MAG: hypothetical protein WC784_02490 [Candidatus Shapirobacteria bacterium]|jgi:hypothetical protein